jgi:Flp pilus assembly protein TadG
MIRLRAFARDERGASIVEFALISPVLLITLFGMFDFGHGLYTRALLQGAIDKASRGSTIQGSTTATLDAKVTSIVRQITPGAAAPTFSRTFYTNFSDVSEAEEYIESNANGTCDASEAYEDANGNGVWDSTRGRIGGGGALDAVLYKVTVTYPRLFPIGRLIGQPSTQSMTAIAVLRNQPYGFQNDPTQSRTCP